MDSEDWRQFHKIGKQIRLRRQEKHRIICYAFASEHGLRYSPIQEWHLRISSDTITLDIYPQGKRYHNMITGKRGSYHKLQGFLNSVFKDDTRKNSRVGSRGPA